jgi:hypothetical protein
MTTANALYASNPLTLDGTERVVLDQASGPTGGALAQAIANLFKNRKGTDLASAATVNLGAAVGEYFHITGTTAITAFDNVPAGITRLVVFGGILTLTYDATAMVLPTSANITTASGDCAIFVSEGSGNWRCVLYDRFSGAPLKGVDIHGLTLKDPPLGADEIVLADSASSWVLAKTTIDDLRAMLLKPNVQIVAAAATVTPTFSDDMVRITAQNAALDLANPNGTAVDGWGIAFEIEDDGTSRAITWDTQYRGIGGTLPAATVAGKKMMFGALYNAADTKWDVPLPVAQET